MAETTIATTQAEGGTIAEPKLLGLEAEGWVYVGLTIFLLLAVFVGKAPKLIAEALDGRIADTRRVLDEAQAIRAEAEALLADAKARTAGVAAEAAALLAHAEAESGVLIAAAEENAKTLIARRTQMATDKIAAAERTAIADVRAHAAESTAAAAHKLILDGHSATADKALVGDAIATLN